MWSEALQRGHTLAECYLELKWLWDGEGGRVEIRRTSVGVLVWHLVCSTFDKLPFLHQSSHWNGKSCHVMGSLGVILGLEKCLVAYSWCSLRVRRLGRGWGSEEQGLLLSKGSTLPAVLWGWGSRGKPPENPAFLWQRLVSSFRTMSTG